MLPHRADRDTTNPSHGDISARCHGHLARSVENDHGIGGFTGFRNLVQSVFFLDHMVMSPVPAAEPHIKVSTRRHWLVDNDQAHGDSVIGQP